MRKTLWLGALGVLLGLRHEALCSEPPAAALNARQLRSALLEAQRGIRSISVTYRSDDYDPKKFPKGTYLHRIVVAKAPSFLYHVSAHGHRRLEWQDDFYQQRAYVTANHVCNEFPVVRTYFEHDIRPEDPLPGTLPRDFFFLATGLWPLRQSEPGGLDYLDALLAWLDKYAPSQREDPWAIGYLAGLPAALVVILCLEFCFRRCRRRAADGGSAMTG